MNISNNDTFQRPMEKIPTEQQSTLLNAIRNKFAKNNENQSGTSPPVLSIPDLKLKHNCMENMDTPSKLNQFILGQLSESKNSSNSGAFAIPYLQIPSKLNGTTLTLADQLGLKNTANENNIISLNNGISNLLVCDKSETHIIDLTTALNRQSTLAESPRKQLASATPNPIDFQIPFIDCDLRDTALRLPSRDEYCQTDVSGFVHSRFISSPSRFGKITCLQYRLPKRKLRVDHGFNVKHEIARFAFNTKSPDDIVLGSMRKYNKV